MRDVLGRVSLPALAAVQIKSEPIGRDSVNHKMGI
jgi:hypothetical protein